MWVTRNETERGSGIDKRESARQKSTRSAREQFVRIDSECRMMTIDEQVQAHFGFVHTDSFEQVRQEDDRTGPGTKMIDNMFTKPESMVVAKCASSDSQAKTDKGFQEGERTMKVDRSGTDQGRNLTSNRMIVCDGCNE